MPREKKEKPKPVLTVHRVSELLYNVTSGENDYIVASVNQSWSCTCPAYGMCKHMRTVIALFGTIKDGESKTVYAVTETGYDAAIFERFKFDFQQQQQQPGA